MGRPSKTIGKNTNDRFTTRNNKQDIFSRITKSSKLKEESVKETKINSKIEVDKADS